MKPIDLAAVCCLAVVLVQFGCVSNRSPARPEASRSSADRPARERRTDDRARDEELRRARVAPQAPVAVALPVHRIERAASYRQGDSTRAFGAARPALRAVDVPAPKARRGPGRQQRADSRGGDGLATALGGEPPAPAAPTGKRDFDSTSFDDGRVASGVEFVPPDAHAAAGPDHVVNVVNVVLRIHDKSGTLVCESDLASFFSAFPTLDNFDLFDPKVLYDERAGRFVVVALEQVDGPKASRILLAVSDDGNPSDPAPSTPCGVWYQAAIDAKSRFFNASLGVLADHWADYPGFAVDEEAVYITGNMFAFNGGSPFGGVRLWTVDKVGGSGGGFYGGGTATVYGPDDPYAGGGLAITSQPAHIFGPPPPTVGTWLTSYSGLTGDCLASPPPGCSPCGSGSDLDGPEYVQLVRVDDPLGMSPTFTQQFLAVTNLEALGDCSSLPEAPQAGTTTTISTNNRQALDSVWRRDRLLLTATIDPRIGADVGQATAHWWSIDTSNPTSPMLAEQGSIGGEDLAGGAHTFFPALAVNAAGDLAIGFSASAPTLYAGSYYLGRRAGGTFDASASTLRVGRDPYVLTLSGSENRWGDYSSMATDPVDQCFWVYNQHALCIDEAGDGQPSCPAAAPANNGRWGTAYGYFCIDCENSPLVLTAPFVADEERRAGEIRVVGSADVLAGVHLGLEGQQVRFDEGFSVAGTLTVTTGFCPQASP